MSLKPAGADKIREYQAWIAGKGPIPRGVVINRIPPYVWTKSKATTHGSTHEQTKAVERARRTAALSGSPVEHPDDDDDDAPAED